MIHVLTPGQMRAADSASINDIGLPGALLMENAAHSSAGIILEHILPDKPEKPLAIFLCGSGNNGGDGFALARHLLDYADVFVFWLGRLESMSPETRTNYEALKKCITTIVQVESPEQIANIEFDCDILIDAMIGVGGSENLRGMVIPLLQKANNAEAIKIAIDAPTGLNTETGAAHKDVFTADYTITMFAVKTGMLLSEGPAASGKIFVASLGVPRSVADAFCNTYCADFDDLKYILPARKRISSKFDYGKALIIAGSHSYPGAAALAANAAVAAGAGLVRLMTTSVHNALKPEVIPALLDSTKDGTIAAGNLTGILREAEKSDALVIGPGLGDNAETTGLVKKLIAGVPKNLPVIIDADGLRAIGKRTKLKENIIITPHCGEFSRITGLERDFIERNSLATAREWAGRLGCTILLKHVPVIIANPENAFLNINGNPGMATGGSGDVLAGIIAALAAQGISTFDSAVAGAFLHAAAGDYYAEKYSMETLAAADLTDSLKYVFHRVHSE